jgi:putative hydrolase of the HAD superfamily
VITDGQSAYARAELHQVGLLGYFDPIIVSGDHGYRKPDRRLFQAAAAGMQVAPEHVLYVGNDMYRDIYGAREAGMATVLFDSDQGTKEYPGCVPDHTLTDHRRLLTILGLDLPPVTSPRPSALPADTAVVADVVASQGGRAAGTGACELPERRTCR